MKYICGECGKLMDTAFAFDGNEYFCSLDCYHEQWSEDEPENEISADSKLVMGLPGSKKHWWNKEREV